MADDDIRSDEVEDDLFPADQPTVDAANPQELRKRRTRNRLEADAGARFWSQCLSTPTGRKECWRILESAHTFETRYACGPNGFPSPEGTWAAHGEQLLGLRIFLTWQRIDRDAVFTMLEENDPRFAKRIPRERKGDE